MNKARVSILKAHDYDLSQIRSAVESGIELIGGLESIIKPGDSIFVKINHLPPPSPPERGIITHPVFVEAVLEILGRASGNITVGDDIQSAPGDGFQVSGFHQMCDRAGVELVNLRQAGFVEVECRGHFLERVHLSRVALEADVIVNLPKLKTHSLTLFTGGVKNMYGTVPTGLRRRFHGEYNKSEEFSQVLVDIFSAVKPQLTIMDGIVAMEGEGPASGDLRQLGLILMSKDAVALDAVATSIIGFDPAEIHTTRYADERGLGVGRLNRIEVVGERIKDVSVYDFAAPASAPSRVVGRLPRSLSVFALRQLAARPCVVKRDCTGCRECAKICPVGAASVDSGRARIDHRLCIRCMCCHEVCRFGAIVLRRSMMGTVIHSLMTRARRLMASFVRA